MRDVYRIGGTLLAAAALGLPAEQAFMVGQAVWVIRQDGLLEPFDAHLETAGRAAPLPAGGSPAGS